MRDTDACQINRDATVFTFTPVIKAISLWHMPKASAIRTVALMRRRFCRYVGLEVDVENFLPQAWHLKRCILGQFGAF